MGSISVQVESHPSPLAVFPSSHVSEACLNPSPHWTVQLVCVTSGLVPPVQAVQVSMVVGVPPVQIYPASIVQVALQPSPGVVFPSSHPSPASLSPSPQIARFLLSVLFSNSPKFLRIPSLF